MALSYGPASVMMLSPLTVTCTGIVFPFGRVKVQPVVSAVAVSWDSTAFFPASSVVLSFHFPAISASDIGAGPSATGGAAAAVGAEAVVSTAGRLSDLPQATRT